MSARRLISLGLLVVTLACRTASEAPMPVIAQPPIFVDTQALRARIYLAPQVNDAVEFCVIVPSPWQAGRTSCVLVRDLRAWIVGRQRAD